MPFNYGTPVKMREDIQSARVFLAYKLVQVGSDASAQLFERLVSDVDNEMLSVSIDKGLPFLSYAKSPCDRWDSAKRTSVSMKKFLATRLGIEGDDVDDLISALAGRGADIYETENRFNDTFPNFSYPK
jgi:hypothetical protein